MKKTSLAVAIALCFAAPAVAQEQALLSTADYVIDQNGIVLQGVAGGEGQAGFIVTAAGNTMRSEPGQVSGGLYAMRLNGLSCEDHISYRAYGTINGRRTEGRSQTIPVRCSATTTSLGVDNIKREMLERDRVARSLASNQ